jgi:hypothetical protein
MTYKKLLEEGIEFIIEKKKDNYVLSSIATNQYMTKKYCFGISKNKQELEIKRENIVNSLDGYSNDLKLSMFVDIKYESIADAKKDFDRLCKGNNIEYIRIGAEGLKDVGYERMSLDYDVVVTKENYEKVKQLAPKYNFYLTANDSEVLEPAIFHNSGTFLHVLVSKEDVPSIDIIKGKDVSPSLEGLILTKLLHINDNKHKTDISELLKLGLVDIKKLKDFLIKNGYESQWKVFENIFLSEGGMDNQIKKESIYFKLK